MKHWKLCWSFVPIVALAPCTATLFSCDQTSGDNPVQPPEPIPPEPPISSVKSVDGADWEGLAGPKWGNYFASDDYTIDHDAQTITYISHQNEYIGWTQHLVIPNYVWVDTPMGEKKPYKVLLGNSCFLGNIVGNGIVELNDFIDEIPRHCFHGSAITEIWFHKPPRIIHDYAFSLCNFLSKIRIKKGKMFDDNWATNLEVVGDYAFNDAKIGFDDSISSYIAFGEKIRSIGKYAFNHTYIRNVWLTHSSQITEISQSTFASCIALMHIYLSDSIKTFGDKAFAQCEQLREIRYPTGSQIVLSIGKSCFNGCQYFAGFNEPVTFSFVGAKAFAGCRRLSFFPWDTQYGLTEVPEQCFNGCYFRKIAIPKSITMIHHLAFSDMPYLCEIDLSVWEKVPKGKWDDSQAFQGKPDSGKITLSPNAFDSEGVKQEWKDFLLKIGFLENDFGASKWRIMVKNNEK